MSDSEYVTGFAFENAMSHIYEAIRGLEEMVRTDQSTLLTRLAAIESKTPPPTVRPTTSASVAPTPSDPTATKPTRKARKRAPTTTPVTGPPAPPTSVRAVISATSKAALPKSSVTLSIPDAQTGHVVGRAGTGLRQIHDISHAKVSVSPTNHSGLRAVSLRGTDREIGDALIVIGKRLARRRVKTPSKTSKPKEKKDSPLKFEFTASAPPVVVVQPPPPSTKTSTTIPPTRTQPFGRPPSQPHSPMVPSTPTGPSYAASPMVVDPSVPPSRGDMTLSTPASYGTAVRSDFSTRGSTVPPTIPSALGSPMEGIGAVSADMLPSRGSRQTSRRSRPFSRP